MKAGLNLAPNMADPDAFYALLVDSHEGLDEEGSKMLNAQLILMLSNHIGDLDVLREALTIARGNAQGGST